MFSQETTVTIRDNTDDPTRGEAGVNTSTLKYVWLKGDYYLQKASDWLKEQAIKEEESNYGNDNTNGL